MIAAACLATGARTAPRSFAARRRPVPCCPIINLATPAAGSAPRTLAQTLSAVAGDGLPAPAPARAADAARGFAAGNGFCTGGLVDRFI